MDFLDDEYQRVFDSDLTSTDSGVSSLFVSEDDRSTTSSTVVSGSSSDSSGEILASVVEDALLLVSPTSSAAGDGITLSLTTARQRCVGGNNKGVTWGFTSITGRRKEMEDAVAVIPGFMSNSCDHVGGCTVLVGSRSPGEISRVHFFGVYDGHGGSQDPKASHACGWKYGFIRKKRIDNLSFGQLDHLRELTNGWTRRTRMDVEVLRSCLDSVVEPQMEILTNLSGVETSSLHSFCVRYWSN